MGSLMSGGRNDFDADRYYGGELDGLRVEVHRVAEPVLLEGLVADRAVDVSQFAPEAAA